MDRENLKIGITLSGGGTRAVVFHLGMFKWLAEEGLMERVEHVSSVSGGSICMGLIYATNNYKWPTSKQFLEEVFPKMEERLLNVDLLWSAIFKLVKQPWKVFSKKSNVLSQTIQEKFNLCGNFEDLEPLPRWSINGTTFETGKNFRFSQKHMGDYKVGYADCSKFSLADAISISAAFPIFVGLYQMNMSKYNWCTYNGQPIHHTQKYIHLWDGGVYDNLGLEAIYKIRHAGRLRDNLNFIIVSNAIPEIEYDTRTRTNITRLLDISMDQVVELRSRDVMDFIERNRNGMYLGIGNSASKITRDSKVREDIARELMEECLTAEDAKRVEDYPTVLTKPTEENYRLILRHGYENAKCVYRCWVEGDKMEGNVIDIA